MAAYDCFYMLLWCTGAMIAQLLLNAPKLQCVAENRAMAATTEKGVIILPIHLVTHN